MTRRNSFGPVLVFAAVSWCLDAWFSPHAARDLALVATEEPQLAGQIHHGNRWTWGWLGA